MTLEAKEEGARPSPLPPGQLTCRPGSPRGLGRAGVLQRAGRRSPAVSGGSQLWAWKSQEVLRAAWAALGAWSWLPALHTWGQVCLLNTRALPGRQLCQALRPQNSSLPMPSSRAPPHPLSESGCGSARGQRSHPPASESSGVKFTWEGGGDSPVPGGRAQEHACAGTVTSAWTGLPR